MMLTAVTLAQVRTDSVGAGPISLLVLVLMGIATAALIWNMNGRLKKLTSRFPPPTTDGVESPEEKREHAPGS